MTLKNKILILIVLAFISILNYGMQPRSPRLYNPVLDEIKYEYANQCYSDDVQMNEFYSCADMKKYIDKLEAQSVLH